MIARICHWLLSLRGWKAVGAMPTAPKFVIIAVPHTSNWDFPVTLLVAAAIGMRVKWLGKHTLFKFPFGGIMRTLGGIPIDRTKRNNMVEQAIEILHSSKRLGLIIPPEGTRSRAKRWKTGFYYTALGAGVPVVCGFLDFSTKIGGIGPAIDLTGNIQEDVKQFRKFYDGIVGKNPENMTPIEIEQPETT